jgi:hypothetical protein
LFVVGPPRIGQEVETDVNEYYFYLNAQAISDLVTENDYSMFLRKPR